MNYVAYIVGMMICLFIAGVQKGYSQSKWSLDRCIEYAKTNSLNIKEQQNKIEQLRIDRNTLKSSYLPSLSSGINQEMDFGRSLTSTNVYQDVNAQTSSFSISSEIELFSGFETRNSIKKNKYDLLAANANKEIIEHNLTFNITSCYFQVLLDKQELQIARQQVKLTEEQVERTKILLKNGKVAGADLYDAYTQLATDKLTVTEANNSLQLALLDLAQAMELNSLDNFDITDADDSIANNEISNLNERIGYYYACMPQIRLAEYNVKSSELQTKVSRAGYYPTLKLNLGINSSYYYINSGENLSFNNQLKNNMQKSMYLSLNIPLFDRHNTRNKIKSSKIDESNSRLALDKVKKELRKNIEKAYYDAIGTYEKYKSTKLAVQANKESFRYAIAKFNAGKCNSYEYNQSKMKLADALSKQAQAKYSYMLKQKILDYYDCHTL